MNRTPIVISAAFLLALSACSEQKSETSKAPAPAATENKAGEPAATAPAPAATAPEAPATMAKDTETVTNEACLAAVAKETNESDVEVLSNEFSEANTLVMVGVGANRATWRCLVSNTGQVAEVMFDGSDSGGVSEPEPDASPAGDLADFVGAKGGQAEMGLNNKGYQLARTEGLTAFWWNAGSGSCARIVTADGRYQSIDMVSPADCGQ
jgi:hypothetical protein